MKKKKIRILIAKPGLDGHDRGAKVVVQALREAGMEVIYTGLHQTVDNVLKAAQEEDVDVIGLSILSGAHLPICENLIKQLKSLKMEGKLVLVGGVIPKKDIQALKELGIKGIFPTGSELEDIVNFIKENTGAING